MKPFEIFRTGTWTSDKGITKNYSEEDLDKIVANYNSEDPAPIVIGHPENNSPAFGWIDSIKRVADRLIAVPKQLNDKFVDLVKNGSFKKRSISITPDFKLNHVGFLGAAAPAVAGLKEIQFSSDEELHNFSSDFNPELVSSPARHLERSRETRDEGLNNATIEQSNNESQKPAITLDSENNPAEKTTPNNKPLEDLKNFEKSLNELNSIVSEIKNNFSQLSDDELKKIHSRINELQFSMQVNDFELRLNEKLAYGSLTPGMKSKIMNLVSFLQKQSFSGNEFSFEKYIADVKNLLIDFVESIPKIIYYENFAEKPESVSIAEDEFENFTLDEDSLLIHKKALQYMKANEGTEYVEAINKVSKE